jgi:hypothetical protein
MGATHWGRIELVQMFKAVLRRADGTEDAPVQGAIEEVASAFRAIDWRAAWAENGGDPTAFPELVVECVSNGDALYLAFDGSKGEFQCTTIVTVPKKVLGLALMSDDWESDAVNLRPEAIAGVLAAFGAKDIEKLRAYWAPPDGRAN